MGTGDPVDAVASKEVPCAQGQTVLRLLPCFDTGFNVPVQ